MTFRLLVALFLAVIAADARGDDVPVPAPLGLVWGMSKSEAEGMGTSLTISDDKSYGVVAIARSLPKALADTGEVYLFFGFNDHLWRVFIQSNKWDNDRYGSQAIARFDELTSLLSDRYGKGTTYFRDPANEYLRAADHFALSLSNNERAHAMAWDAKGVSVELILKAQFEDTFYTLAYEHKALAEAARAAIKDREKGAL